MKKINFANPDLTKYIGSIAQVAGIRRFEYAEGRAKGVTAFDVRTGGGLNYTVLADRCLDIGSAEYKGIPFGYTANVGVVSPMYFDPRQLNFFRSFSGLMSTCGLTYLGAPCVDAGEELGLHGRIGNTPAEEISAVTDWSPGGGNLVISGKIRESRFFGENLVMRREVLSPLGENRIRISDQITNEGFSTQPLMFLYHVNFGFPLLAEGAEILAPIREIIPRDEDARKGLGKPLLIEKPQNGYREQVFYLDLMSADDDAASGGDSASIALINEELGFGIYEKFPKEQLNCFVLWKQMGEGYYVLGLEPGNCFVEGRAAERQRGFLQQLEPGETRQFQLEIGVLENRDEIERFREKVRTTVLLQK